MAVTWPPSTAYEGWGPVDDGWDLFDTGGSGRTLSPYSHDPLELQRDDELEVFPSDAAAWRHVVTAAAAGSPVHLAAIQHLCAESPGEIIVIAEWLATHPDPKDDLPCPK